MSLLPNWQLFDRIRAYLRSANVFRQDNLYQDQTDISRVMDGGNFIEFSKQSGLLEQTNLQINRLERYKDYDMMDEVGEITLALDLYADESSLTDPERKHSLIVRSKSKKVKEAVEDFLYNTIMIDREIRPIIRYLCKYGDFVAELVPTKNRDGLSSFRHINVYNFTRVQTKFGDLVGFFYQDPNTLTPIFLHPWQVAHMRLASYEQQYTPYGRSLLDGVRKDFKRLRLMEDAALIYRITRAPEKRIFSIPIGNIPADKIYQYITEIARTMKKHKFVDPATGQVNERYSPLIQEDDFFLPKRADGTGPEITTLPGAENLDEIADIVYFKKKMISGLKIPMSRVGLAESTDADSKSLASTSPEFAKTIQWIQREVAIGLKKMTVVHLALKKFDVEEIRSFDLYMTAASAIDELYRIETWATRADIIGSLKETDMFDDIWILEHFTDMSRDEIELMQTEKKRKKEEEPEEEEVAAIGEEKDVDNTLLLEYKEFRNRILGKKDVIQDHLKWFVNSNELDGFPAITENENAKIEIKTSIENKVLAEAKDEYRSLIKGEEPLLDDNDNDDIYKLIDDNIGPEQKVINEDKE